MSTLDEAVPHNGLRAAAEVVVESSPAPVVDESAALAVTDASAVEADPDVTSTATPVPCTHPAPGAETRTMPLLELSDIVVAFGTRRVLDGISLSVAEGEFVGVIGPNGAGKSTLLKVILGLITPASGAVRFPALHLRGHRPGSLVGYVPQRFDPDPDLPLRARDLVGLGLDGHRWGFPLPNRTREARVEEALLRVDALRYADAPVGRLSGGELQRLLIAQALVSRPRLLLLDEPLASLDIRSTNEIVEVVHRVAHEQHVTVLLVTHDMNPLLPVMDRILYLANGHAALGRVDEVVRRDVLRSLYGYDVDVLRVRNRILVVGDELASGDAARRRHMG